MGWFDFDGHASEGDDFNAPNAGVKGSAWSGKKGDIPWYVPTPPALWGSDDQDIAVGDVDAFWGQNADGSEAGAKVDLTSVKSQGPAFDLGGVRVQTETSGPNAKAHAFATDTGIDAGIQMNAGEAAVTFGGQGDDQSQTDGGVKIGVSEGAGAGWRLHYGDQDGDQVRELGFGIDAGPLSFDVKSEWLGGLYKDYNAWKGPPVGWPEDKPWEPEY
jgi:hypothetical protein